ncbi:unnamed protein product [Microthlaspi erraticum]|uniref:Reverse transcriptase domain-containing protein n=1 Tax=Microthlaspi erraticum TaxID=1685480 RepID=A0A6D2HT14_9BRAS|nr:unnamed protein product [Microthlaspi erraticum]
MKYFFWNVRGLNGDTKQLAVKRWITFNRPLFGGLLETRVKFYNLPSMMNRCFHGWRFDSNHSEEAENGRIVIVWNPILSVITYLKTDQLLLCGVYNPISRASITDSFPDSNALFDVPGCSDHSPCLVTVSNSEQRRASCFNFFTFFTLHPDYTRLITEAWNSIIHPSDPMFSLYQKLRSAKLCCKALNHGSFSNIQARSREAFQRLEDVQRQALSTPSQELFEEERLARDSWLMFASAEESFFRQKSRIRWLKEGDANTGFFHKSVKSNLSTNVIHFLSDPLRNRISETNAMKATVLNYYKNLLGSSNDEVSPLSVNELQSKLLYRCPSSLAEIIVKIPTDEEIRDTIFSLPKNKAPGPDGFTVEFFTMSWDLVGQDLTEAVKSFFINGSLRRQVNSTVISLIPKTPGASVLTDFRPISLCNTVYKVISKNLAARLKLVTVSAVQRNQVGFVNGRLLCENVLLASELVNDFHKPGQISRGCQQIDITKAYDNGNWVFVPNILEALHLPQTFINWIKLCITSPHYSVAFNGELVGFFAGKKGLRQGDPISSSLFVLAMDVLSKSLDEGTLLNRFRPHPLCSNPLITHLSFADDLLVFFDGRAESLQGIFDILKDFQKISGLALSLTKTSLFLDGDNYQVTHDMAARFGIRHGSLPVRYLGLPLLPKKLSLQDCQPLLDRVRSRIGSWTVRPLSFAGRLQLIKSVLNGIINFWASIFPLPKRCMEVVERMLNAFLWSGSPDSTKGVKVSWETACTPKKAGRTGFSVGSLDQSKNHPAKGLLTFGFRASGSWIWRRLMKLRDLARPFLVCQVVSGRSALFWLDNWTALGPLIDIIGANGPRISGIPRMATVSQALVDGSWSLPRGRHPITVLLRNCLPPPPVFNTQSSVDIYLWKNDQNSPPGKFSMAKTWKSIHPSPRRVPWYDAVWFKEHVPKHAFISWLAVLNRLVTRDRMRSWGLVVPEEYLLCGSSVESRNHLFFSCSYSQTVWNSFFTHGTLSPPTDFDGIISWISTCLNSSNLRTICKLLFQAVVYYLWAERNARIHSPSLKTFHTLVKEIKLTLRAKLSGLDRAALQTANSQSRQSSSLESLLHTWFEFIQLT